MSLFFTNYGTFPLSREPPATKTISSFDEVVLTKPKPLVLCDIDETLLYYEKELSHFVGVCQHTYDSVYSQFKIPTQYISRDKHREAKVNSMASILYSDYINSAGPKPTDIDGFRRLVRRAKVLGGEVKFLTARGEKSAEFTRNNFAHIDVNYDDFDVHYTNASPKGEYIKSRIQLDGFGEVCFIDDLDHNIKNVSLHYPDIACYMFSKTVAPLPTYGSGEVGSGDYAI